MIVHALGNCTTHFCTNLSRIIYQYITSKKIIWHSYNLPSRYTLATQTAFVDHSQHSHGEIVGCIVYIIQDRTKWRKLFSDSERRFGHGFAICRTSEYVDWQCLSIHTTCHQTILKQKMLIGIQ